MTVMVEKIVNEVKSAQKKELNMFLTPLTDYELDQFDEGNEDFG